MGGNGILKNALEGMIVLRRGTKKLQLLDNIKIYTNTDHKATGGG